MLSLTIHHNIHLTRDERYSLHNGVEIIVVGVSVPVWFAGKTTSEPAKEVFCRYFLRNPKKEMPIQILEDGYEISMPYREGTVLAISDEDWHIMNRDDPAKLEAMYKMQISEISSNNLLDVKDGGCGGLCYREHNKIKSGDGFLNIMHYICIEPIEHLTNSLSTSLFNSL